MADTAFFAAGKGNELIEGVRKVRRAQNQAQAERSTESTGRWPETAEELLRQLRNWSTVDGEEQDYFHEKAVLYAGAVEVVPDGELRRRTRGEFFEHLEWAPPG